LYSVYDFRQTTKHALSDWSHKSIQSRSTRQNIARVYQSRTKKSSVAFQSSQLNDMRERPQVVSLVASRRNFLFVSQPADYPGCDLTDIDLLTASRILVVVRTYETGMGGCR
jgi:hypothetical protein